MKSVCFILLFSLAAITCCFSQPANPIQGIVTDSVDNSPIPGCSVFINGSSRGTATDSAGIFNLALAPAGEYQLVISAIGYETYTFIFSGSKFPLDTRIRLRRRADELAAVTIEPYLSDGWRKWGSLFRDNFIGVT